MQENIAVEDEICYNINRIFYLEGGDIMAKRFFICKKSGDILVSRQFISVAIPNTEGLFKQKEEARKGWK